MTVPLWQENEQPTFAQFFDIQCINTNDNHGIAVSWNQIVENPAPKDKLLGIQIRPSDMEGVNTMSEDLFDFETYPINYFEFGSVIT